MEIPSNNYFQATLYQNDQPISSGECSLPASDDIASFHPQPPVEFQIHPEKRYSLRRADAEVIYTVDPTRSYYCGAEVKPLHYHLAVVPKM
jgi:hypothetical protein